MKNLEANYIELSLDDLNQQRIAELHGEGYKKGDIRTYNVAPLASNPSNDIEIHEQMPVEKGVGSIGMGTTFGYILGTSHSTSLKQAANKVFHFPRAAEFNDLQLVKKVELATAYPVWMIERYGIDNLGHTLTHIQSTSVYLNNKSGLFTVLFDEAFLDQIDASCVTSELSREDSGSVRVITSKTGKAYLSITSNDFQEVTRDSGHFNRIKKQIIDSYVQLFITAQNTEKVLCVSLSSADSDGGDLTSRSVPVTARLRNIIKEQGLRLDMNYVVAAKRDDSFYPFRKDGTIATDTPFYFKRKHADSHRSMLGGKGLGDGGEIYGCYMDESEWSKRTTLIIPYTDKDYEFVSSVVSRLQELQAELISFFKLSESRTDGIDTSFCAALENYKGESPLLIGSVKS